MTSPVFFQFFCDDSGNTGPDFIEPNQPIYVEAGWIVPVATIDNLERDILDFEASLRGQSAEKKAKTVLKTYAGLTATTKLFELLQEAGCIPVFVLAEKRYCIACKIVETFLDSEYNDSVETEELWDTEGRQDIAEIFCDLPNEMLTAFAKAYRSIDLAALTMSAKDVSAWLKKMGQRVLAPKVLDCIPHLSKLCRLEKESVSWLPNQGMKALNTPVLINLFSLIEGHGVKTRTRIDMIHDDTPYQEALEQVFRQYKSAKRTRLSLPNGTAYFGYRHLTSLRFSPSIDTPFLRAADFLAGLISKYAVTELIGAHIRPELILTARTVVSEAFRRKLGWILVSYKFARRGLRPLLKTIEGDKKSGRESFS